MKYQGYSAFRGARDRLLSTSAVAVLVVSPTAAHGSCTAAGTATMVTCDGGTASAHTDAGVGAFTVTDQVTQKVVLVPNVGASPGHTQTLTITGHSVVDSTSIADSAVVIEPNVADVNVFLNIDAGVSIISGNGGNGGIFIRNTNSGDISIRNAGYLTENYADAITATGHDGDIHILNSGRVGANSTAGRGIYADGGYSSATPVTVSVENSGTVSANAAGIRAVNYLGQVSIANSGTVTSTYRQGMIGWSPAGGIDMVNTGTVTSGDDHAMQAAADGDVVVVNSGTLAASDDTSHADQGSGHSGIYAVSDSGSVSVTNSGSIRTTGAAAHGIYVSGVSSSVTNSGAITATGAGSYAIYFSGSGNTLTLLDGTALSGGAGALYLGTGTAVRVNVNHAARWTYDGTLSSLSSSGSAVAADAGDAIVTVGTGGLGMASAIDATRGLAVANMLSRISQQSVASPVRVASAADVALPAPPPWNAWAMGYGENSQRGSSDDPRVSSSIWGMAAGLDRYIDADGTTVGVFVGRDATHANLDDNTQRLRAQNLYVGLRAGQARDEGLFWHVAGMGGVGDIKSRRSIDGASAPSRYSTDMQFADMVAGGGYHQILGMGFGATYSGRANYGIRRTEGYSETVSGIDLDVDDRISQTVGGRVQAGLDFWGLGRVWQASPYVAVEGWHGVGADSTDYRFGGISRTVTDDTNQSVGIALGLTVDWNFENGTKLSAVVEGRHDRDGTTATQGFLRAAMAF